MLTRVIAACLLLCSFNLQAKLIPSIFGSVDEQDPVILELIDSNVMQRLKHIDQSGPTIYYTNNFPAFSRYDHSIGVYALLKLYNVSRQEQVAGLLHDSSHTVFSHLADILFQSGDKRTESYQDAIHDWFLNAMHVDKIIAKYNMSTKQVSPKNPRFLALEQPYPDMNADRIEYNLHTGLIFNDLDENEIENILEALEFKNNTWYFTNIKQAKTLAKLSTYYTKTFWSNSQNVALYTVAGAAVKYALDHNLLTKDDLHFGIDQDTVDILNNSKDPILQSMVSIMRNIDHHYIVADRNNYDVYQPIKMRGFDPLVMNDNKLQRLSTLSSDFKSELKMTQEYANNGNYIKFKDITNQKVMQLLVAANT